MKLKMIFAALLAVALAGSVGCVKTVSGKKTAGVPWKKDRVEDRYERPANQVYDAAIKVIQFNGALANETTLHSDTNAVPVRTLEGRINQRTVYVRVEPLDAKVTYVAVQARTKTGGTDVDLAHEVSKQIALELVK